MIIGWAINSAMILMAAATLYQNGSGKQVDDLTVAGKMLSPLLGNAATVVFALALLLAGISSSITAGMAGGTIFSGIFNQPYDIKTKETKRGVLLTMIPALDIGVYALSFIRWFMDSKPDQLLSQVKAAPTGVDEQAGLLLMNPEGQMATVMLSLHSKQPKRGMISCEKGYIEIMEYPRAWEARITYVETGDTEVVRAGENADALAYELADMEKAIAGDEECMHFEYTKDVMDMMTEFRKSWKFTYPEEE